MGHEEFISDRKKECLKTLDHLSGKMNALSKIKGCRLAEKPRNEPGQRGGGALLIDASSFVGIYADISEDKCSRNRKLMLLPRNSPVCENRKRLRNYFSHLKYFH